MPGRPLSDRLSRAPPAPLNRGRRRAFTPCPVARGYGAFAPASHLNGQTRRSRHGVTPQQPWQYCRPRFSRTSAPSLFSVAAWGDSRPVTFDHITASDAAGSTAEPRGQRSVSLSRFVASKRNETRRPCSSMIEHEKRSSTGVCPRDGNSTVALCPFLRVDWTSVFPSALTATKPSQAGQPDKNRRAFSPRLVVATAARGATHESAQIPYT